MKIKFLYSGGTIGMKADSNGSLVAPANDEEFRKSCLPSISEWQEMNGIEIDYEYCSGKDSSNMTPDDWQAMLYRVRDAQAAGYDAITIAHGTDTLSYTACAIALGMRGRESSCSALTVPVILTGAQTPIYEFGGDGLFNLHNLFRTAKAAVENDVVDVMINFGYNIFLGSRAIKTSERVFNAFESPVELGRVGYIDAFGVHLIRDRVALRGQMRPTSITPRFSKGVLIVDLTPGTEPGLLEGIVKNGGVLAMVIKAFGEGNVCNEGTYNLVPFIHRVVNDYQVPVLLASKFLGGSVGRSTYAPGRTALNAGAIACFDTSDCAVEVKIRWLLGNGIASSIEQIREAMATSYVGEVSPV